MKNGKTKSGRLRKKLLSAAMCLFMVNCTVIGMSGCGMNVKAIAEPSYPKLAPYPDYEKKDSKKERELWREQENKRRDAGKNIVTPADFYKSSAEEFLADENGENKVYSPVNIYMALAMLAETTDGNSRAQILGMLGETDVGSLRAQAKNIWDANYRDDVKNGSILANSVWLNKKFNYNSDTAKTLSDNYLASVYSGDPASEDMTKALRKWLNDNTGGLLKDSAESAKLSPDTVMALCSTVYFRARWIDEFSSKFNEKRTFHGKRSDVETDFMTRSDYQKKYFYGEDYGAIVMYFTGGGGMWLILPDEDKTVEDVLAAGEYLNMMDTGYMWERSKEMKINYYVPKFDFTCDTDLKDVLGKLGVTDVFDPASADFSPLTSDIKEIYVSSAKHSARVTIDEEGCTAAAFTEMLMGAGSALPPELEEIDFVLDRPFIFVIQSDTKQPLFIGTVNQL